MQTNERELLAVDSLTARTHMCRVTAASTLTAFVANREGGACTRDSLEIGVTTARRVVREVLAADARRQPPDILFDALPNVVLDDAVREDP